MVANDLVQLLRGDVAQTSAYILEGLVGGDEVGRFDFLVEGVGRVGEAEGTDEGSQAGKLSRQRGGGGDG